MERPTNAAQLSGNKTPDNLLLPSLQRQAAQRRANEQANNEFQKTVQLQATGVHPNDRGVFFAFANLGKALGDKIKGDAPLLPEDQAKIAMMEKANERIKELQKDGNWQGLSSQEKAFRTQEAMASAALDVGDFQTFAQVSEKVHGSRQAAQRAEAEARKAGIQEKKAGVDLESAEFKRDKLDPALLDSRRATAARTRKLTDLSDAKDRREMSKVNTFAVYDDNGKLQTIHGRFNEDGLVVDPVTGQKYAGAMTPGDVDKLTKAAARAADLDESPDLETGINALSMKQRFDVANKLVEIKSSRDSFGAARTQLVVANKILDSMENMVLGGQDATSAIGLSGKIVSLVDNIQSTVKGLGGAFKGGFNGLVLQDGGGNKLASGPKGFQKYAQDNNLIGDINIPTALNEAEAAKYRSNIVDLAYSVARVNESGGRYSDQDLKRVMEQIGANSGNPETLRAVVTDLVTSKVKGVRSNVARIGGIERGFNLPKGSLVNSLFGEEAVEQFLEGGEALGERSAAMKGIGTETGDDRIRENANSTTDESQTSAAEAWLEANTQ